MRIVFTFDDCLQSHYDFVRPIFKDYGYPATFFVTQAGNLVAFSDIPENRMSWDQVAKLNEERFEIGNHTWSHVPFRPDKDDIIKMEKHLNSLGIKTTSFAYPGWGTSKEYTSLIRQLGFTRQRVGYTTDGNTHLVRNPGERDLIHYHSKGYLVFVTGVINDMYTFDMFVHDLEDCPSDQVVIMAAHGFAKPERRVFMKNALEHVKHNNWQVLRLKDV